MQSDIAVTYNYPATTN